MDTTITTTRTTTTRTAAERLYDAECALHAARQAHVEAWIDVASERLHAAVAAYLTDAARRPRS